MLKKMFIVLLFPLLFMASIVPSVEAKKGKTASTDEIITIAKEYIGTPYRFGGTTPRGFDCSGYTGYVFKQVGIDLPRSAADQYSVGESIRKSDLTKGDLVFFETYKPGPSHNGIYIGDGKFIHSSSSRGVTISNVNDPHYWGSRYLGARRVVEEVEQTLPELPRGEFYDVSDNHWANTAITALSTEGIINGFSGSVFRPADTITRAQAATILARALELPMDDRTVTFKDVSENHPSLAAINAVHQAGLFNGNSNGNFRPNDTVTREHIAVIFTRAFNLSPSDNPIDFTDVRQSHRNYNSIQALAASGIAAGFSDGTFRPSDETNRAQFTTFLYRALR